MQILRYGMGLLIVLSLSGCESYNDYIRTENAKGYTPTLPDARQYQTPQYYNSYSTPAVIPPTVQQSNTNPLNRTKVHNCWTASGIIYCD